MRRRKLPFWKKALVAWVALWAGAAAVAIWHAAPGWAWTRQYVTCLLYLDETDLVPDYQRPK